MVTAGSPRLPDSVGPVVSTGLPRVALVWTTRDGDEDRRVVVIGLTSRRRTVHLASAMPNFADASLHSETFQKRFRDQSTSLHVQLVSSTTSTLLHHRSLRDAGRAGRAISGRISTLFTSLDLVFLHWLCQLGCVWCDCGVYETVAALKSLPPPPSTCIHTSAAALLGPGLPEARGCEIKSFVRRAACVIIAPSYSPSCDVRMRP